MEVRKSGTRSNTRVLMLCALIPAGMWAGAMKIIDETKGSHSTAGIWALLLGLPGDMLGAWIGQRTDSDPASYFAAFLGIWLFWFALLKVAVAIKLRLSRSQYVALPDI